MEAEEGREKLFQAKSIECGDEFQEGMCIWKSGNRKKDLVGGGAVAGLER